MTVGGKNLGGWWICADETDIQRWKDVEHVGVMKDKDGNVLTDSKSVRERWKEKVIQESLQTRTFADDIDLY